MDYNEIYAEMQKPEMKYLVYGVFIISLVIRAIFALTIRKTLLLIKEENRCLMPSQVWGLVIPLFNIYWNFEVARKLTDSLNNEFYDRKIAVDEDPTLKPGRLYAWLYLAANVPLISGMAVYLSIFSLIAFGNYWIKIVAFKKLLIKHNELRDQEVFENED